MADEKKTIVNKKGETEAIEDQYLLDAGFERDDDERDAQQSVCDAQGMDNGGPYHVRGVYKKGDVTMHFETNVSTVVQQGMSSSTNHPQVCVIKGPKGRVACRADDTELQLQMAEEMA